MEKKDRVLTGITCTGEPHIGNYVGAIRPGIEASNDNSKESFFFMADLHALIKCQSPKTVYNSSLAIAATWLALGINTDNSVFYRQSDVPEISELCWILNCVAAKGLLNRAHAYKAAVDANLESNNDPDAAITMGIYSYPVLMSADIIMFNANKVPVGKDQIQHVEMARDIAGRFNHIYEELFVLPEVSIDSSTPILNGLDGRKMSKSYNNTIPIFLGEKKLRKTINKIKTNLLEPGEPKDPDSSTVFQIWQAFATPDQTAEMRQKFENGIAWGEAKAELFELINGILKEPRMRYQEIVENPEGIELALKSGAEKARDLSAPLLEKVKKAVGISPFKKV
ncbi:tryptophan--tRNA ligase [Aliikangiella coralliicola]|uniref:Tryptophan--tRNA ligase n=1 Tax=Aliikangiella coralliicola TaxID=2592383 RepID=A0A545UE89_9GAMM|nr:tryptophan--tRNA ligase [Aliikangiella coralliicola]TQV87794.1 tryptophan--tRNA ligase [Aliikangiella coralliicola]